MASKKTLWLGGCACKQLRFEVSAEPIASFICFCRNCQLSGGTEGAPVFSVPKHSVVIKGKSKKRDYLSDRGTHMHSHFCSDCGSRVYGLCDEMPEIVIFRAGVLDNIESFSPEAYIYTSNAPSWIKLRDDLPKFEGMPPLPEPAKE